MTPPSTEPVVSASEEEMATALDSVVDALRAGRAVDREALLKRYPQLTGALDGLLCLAPSAPLRDVQLESLPPQTRIGPYVIERELGAGGFGIVYQAQDPDVKRRVALKVLHPGRLAQPE